MALTAIAICSRALLKLGAEPLTGFDDGTAESIAASVLYPSTRDALLSCHPWNFAVAQKSLARLAAAPAADYAYAYQIPGDFLRALSAGPDGRGHGADYRIIGRRLHSNAAAVTLSYLFRAPEASFPPFFDQALIARMAAELCLPLTESVSRAESLHRLAERELRQARLIDSQQDTPPRLEHFPLVEARG